MRGTEVDIEGKVSNLDMVAEGRAVTIVILSKVGVDLPEDPEEAEKALKEQQKKEREAWEKVYVGAVVKGSLEVVEPPKPPPEESGDGGRKFAEGEPPAHPADKPPEEGPTTRPPDGGRPVAPKPGGKR